MIAGQPKPQPRVILAVSSTASDTIPIDLPDDVEVKVVPHLMFEPYGCYGWPPASIPAKRVEPPKRQTLADLGPKPNRQERRRQAALRRRSFRR